MKEDKNFFLGPAPTQIQISLALARMRKKINKSLRLDDSNIRKTMEFFKKLKVVDQPKLCDPLYYFFMKLKVKIIYRDDKEEIFLCNDFPYVSEWITIYLENWRRKMLPKEAVKSIEYWFEK